MPVRVRLVAPIANHIFTRVNTVMYLHEKNMKYEKHLSKLRNVLLQVQGQTLIHVLLRAAKARAEQIAENMFTVEDIYSALEAGIYKHTDELSQQACFNIVSDLECLSEIKEELIESH